MTRRSVLTWVSPMLLLTGLACGLADAQDIGRRIGVGLEGAGGRGLEFVDVARTLRPFEGLNGQPVAKDASGWPKGDCKTVFFDLRPVFAWAPPMDDPKAYQINVSGTYALSFVGQARVEPAEGADGLTVTNLKYDQATNTTTASVTLAPGKGMMVVKFLDTRLTPQSPTNTGIRDIRLIRPGYPADTKQTFTTEFLRAVEPFAVMRFMDFTATNNHSPHNGYYPQTIQWKDRTLPGQPRQSNDVVGHKGMAWEYVIELANLTGKDIWINVPAEASDDYVRQLALLLKAGLKPSIRIYIEHSNEVWNWMFYQAVYNRMAAEDEIKKGNSNLNSDGKNDLDTLRARRHARRVIEIGNTFREVFGEKGATGRVRPVLAWWTINPGQYADMLQWAQQHYGKPSDLFYAIASTGYFNVQKNKAGNVDQLLQAMRDDIEDGAKYWDKITSIAETYGLKHCLYEGGPDTGGGNPANIANRILAERDPRMAELIRHQIKDNWFGRARGDLYMYFTLTSGYSRYGCWGATEDVTRLDTPKYQALLGLIGPKHPQR